MLLVGETGTGKDVAARMLARADAPHVSINCAAVPLHLCESELFGHVRGAFTGAVSSRTGLCVAAGAGTLFLDEIGDLALELQAKLLRLIEAKELRPVGSATTIPFRAKVVAATCVDLERAIAEGRFRRDLYFRLAQFVVHLPALRTIPDDIPTIAEHIIKSLSHEMSLTPCAFAWLKEQRFPGNVRELLGLLTRASVLSGPTVSASDLANLCETPTSPKAPEPLHVTRGSLSNARSRSSKCAWCGALSRRTTGTRAARPKSSRSTARHSESSRRDSSVPETEP